MNYLIIKKGFKKLCSKLELIMIPLLLVIFTFVLYSCKYTNEKNNIDTLYLPVDRMATTNTRNLYASLKDRMKRGIMIGHQDDLAYGCNWYKEKNRSDVFDVCGDYPAVIGWDLGNIELGISHNIDSVGFAEMKRYIKTAHKRGCINTISWHANNIINGGSAWDCKQKLVVRNILPGGYYHKKYLSWLNRLADFFIDLRDISGDAIPVVFRMYHQQTENWYWWDSDQCTPEEYKQVWIMTYKYLQEKKDVHNVLYAYTTSNIESEKMFLERYPGDEYVDILGFDLYLKENNKQAIDFYKKRMNFNLNIITTYAAKVNKVPIIGETGMRSIEDSTYFTKILYPLIHNYKISYVLLWRNAWEQDKQDLFYAPFRGHPSCKDFRSFIKNQDIFMCKSLKNQLNK